MAALALDERQVRRGPASHRRLGSASNSPTRASANSTMAYERAALNGPTATREHSCNSGRIIQPEQVDVEKRRSDKAKERSLHELDTAMSFTNVRGLQLEASRSISAIERDDSGALSARTVTGARDMPSAATSIGDSLRHATPGAQVSPDSRDRGSGACTFLAQGYAHRKQVLVSLQPGRES